MKAAMMEKTINILDELSLSQWIGDRLALKLSCSWVSDWQLVHCILLFHITQKKSCLGECQGCNQDPQNHKQDPRGCGQGAPAQS